MIGKLVTSIINVQLRIGTIQEEQVEIYRYGYTLLIEVLINIVFSIAASILLGKVKEYVLFMCLFIPLRSFCGGYHAKTAWKCIMLSNAAIIAAVLFGDYMARYSISLIWYLVIDIILGIIIFSFSPIESLNNRLSYMQRKIYKKCARIIFTLEAVVGLLFFLIQAQSISFLIICEHFILTISLIVEKIFKMEKRKL